jgi:hypothetical protein
MSDQPSEQAPLSAQRVEGELDTDRLALDQERADLVDADPMLLGMRIGNLIYAAVYGIGRRKGE